MGAVVKLSLEILLARTSGIWFIQKIVKVSLQIYFGTCRLLNSENSGLRLMEAFFNGLQGATLGA
jgi:hypothetical protein